MSIRTRLLVGFAAALLLTVSGVVVSEVFTADNSSTIINDRSSYRGPYRFTGKEDHALSLKDAEAIIQNFRRGVPAGTVVGGFFAKEALLSMLSHPDVVGMRAYYALEGNGSPTLVLFGVDANGNDIVDSGPLERWFPCPPFCPQYDTLAVVMK